MPPTLTHVDRIRTPLLVVQGTDDLRVVRAESDNLVAALRDRGVAVEYLVEEDEGHGFVNPENQIDMFRAVEWFLAGHLGGRSEPRPDHPREFPSRALPLPEAGWRYRRHRGLAVAPTGWQNRWPGARCALYRRPVPNDDPARAAPDSLLGAVQRGRGTSRAMARARPREAGEAVLACLARDPRWDRQVEERGWLYATLAQEAGIEPVRLGAAITGEPDEYGDDGARLAVDVLALLARRGVPGSVGELRRYLGTRRDPGLALDALLPLAAHPEAAGLLDDILDAAASDDRVRQALTETAGRWPAPWCDRLARFRPAPRRPPVPGRAARRTADRTRVLRAAADRALITDSAVAERDWESILLRIAADLLHDDTPVVVSGTVWRCLRELRSPAARRWARTHAGLGGSVAAAGLAVLADTAEPSDIPRLRELLTAAAPLGTAALAEQCALVPALARAGDTAVLPLVDHLFDTTVYSYLRSRCAEALAHLDPAFPHTRALECLDDCEPGTRAVGVAHADRSLARRRLGCVVGDRSERESIRAAARTRLTTIRRI